MTAKDLKYQRILLKISGEGFSGSNEFGFDSKALDILADQIIELLQMGVQPAVVVGAGNFIRGAVLSRHTPVHRATADQMGMLATVINAIALKDILDAKGAPARVLSAINITTICEPFIRLRAIRHLEKGRIVILAGGTGNPFFTTDTCAALRAAEIHADVLIKATKVDGVYSADPMKDPAAQIYEKLSCSDVIHQNLQIMDHAAISLCRNNNIDILVCNLMKSGSIAQIVRGEKIGTLISK